MARDLGRQVAEARPRTQPVPGLEIITAMVDRAAVPGIRTATLVIGRALARTTLERTVAIVTTTSLSNNMQHHGIMAEVMAMEVRTTGDGQMVTEARTLRLVPVLLLLAGGKWAMRPVE